MLSSRVKLSMISVLVAVAMTFSFATAIPAAACASSGSPVVSTDKSDYGAMETASISASGFGCGEVLSVLVTAPDGVALTGDGTGTPGPDVITTDGNGEFTLSYALSGWSAGSPTSIGGGVYAGQSGTYTVEVLSTAGVLLASTTFTDQAHPDDPVPPEVIVTHDGLEWVWASPCALNGCTSGILVGKDGFGFASQAEWARRPPASAFYTGDPSAPDEGAKCAAPWFDLSYNYCDWEDPTYGAYGSAPRRGLPAGHDGNYPMPSYGDTWLVRTPSAPPTANAGGPYQGDEGAAIAMSGASAPAGALVSWSVDSWLCSFDDASLLKPNLTCTDNGNFVATLTVSDGVTPAVTSNAYVTANNVAPTIAISGASNVNEGSPYSLTLGASHRPGHGHGISLHRVLGRR